MTDDRNAPAFAFQLPLDAPQLVQHVRRVAAQQDKQRQRRRVAEAAQLRARVRAPRVWLEFVNARKRSKARHKLGGHGVGEAM